MTSSVTNLIKFIKDNYKRICDDEISIKLSIDNIECILYLSIEPDDKNQYSFYIDSRYLDYCLYDIEKFNDINKCCSKIDNIINNYKFSRFINKFVSDDTSNFNKELINVFSDINENCTQEYNCPICMENEGTMNLKCFHKICYTCRIKIIKSDLKAKCPICKSACIYDTTNDLYDETLVVTGEFQLSNEMEELEDDSEDDSDDELDNENKSEPKEDEIAETKEEKLESIETDSI